MQNQYCALQDHIQKQAEHEVRRALFWSKRLDSQKPTDEEMEALKREFIQNWSIEGRRFVGYQPGVLIENQNQAVQELYKDFLSCSFFKDTFHKIMKEMIQKEGILVEYEDAVDHIMDAANKVACQIGAGDISGNEAIEARADGINVE